MLERGVSVSNSTQQAVTLANIVIGQSGAAVNNEAVIPNSLCNTAEQCRVGTFTMTGTGFSTPQVTTAHYHLQNNAVTIYLPGFTGASNATTLTLTGIPGRIQATHDMYQVVRIVDNGVAAFGVVRVNANVGTWDVFPNAALSAWTGTGAKSLIGQSITYSLD